MLRLPGMDHTSPDAILTDTPAFLLLVFQHGHRGSNIAGFYLIREKSFPAAVANCHRPFKS
jgi:hypothetical protein